MPLLALIFLVQALDSCGWAPPSQVKCVHSCDIFKPAQEVLKGWNGIDGAQHVYCDVKERWSEPLRHKLEVVGSQTFLFLAPNMSYSERGEKLGEPAGRRLTA